MNGLYKVLSSYGLDRQNVYVTNTKACIVLIKICHLLSLFKLVGVIKYIILVIVVKIAKCTTLVTTEDIPQKSQMQYKKVERYSYTMKIQHKTKIYFLSN